MWRRRAVALPGAALALSLAAACGSTRNLADAARITARPTTTTPPTANVVPQKARARCGVATPETLASADGEAAERIYFSELSSSQTTNDKRQVETYEPLLAAIAANNRAGVGKAVEELVYSHTHIVRLRVSRAGKLLADLGGPYIIAPVAGTLRRHGRIVGTYLLSVQDDLGYVGLENRLIGRPVELRLAGKHVPLEGTVRTGHTPLPSRGPIKLHGRHFQVYSFNAKAYPAGTLRISLLIPPVRASRSSCSAVRVDELGRIGHRIWNRFVIDKSPASGFVVFAHEHTGGLYYVQSHGEEVAGNTRPVPPGMPAAGEIHYQGRLYGVTSFAAGSYRIYQLVPL
jgi:hypothetical protein